MRPSATLPTGRVSQGSSRSSDTRTRPTAAALRAARYRATARSPSRTRSPTREGGSGWCEPADSTVNAGRSVVGARSAGSARAFAQGPITVDTLCGLLPQLPVRNGEKWSESVHQSLFSCSRRSTGKPALHYALESSAPPGVGRAQGTSSGEDILWLRRGRP